MRSSASTTRTTYDDGSEYKGGNHKLYEYSDRDMADLKVQTGQSYFATKTRNQSKAMAIYFLAAINKLSRYERVPPLVWRRVSIC